MTKENREILRYQAFPFAELPELKDIFFSNTLKYPDCTLSIAEVYIYTDLYRENDRRELEENVKQNKISKVTTNSVVAFLVVLKCIKICCSSDNFVIL